MACIGQFKLERISVNSFRRLHYENYLPACRSAYGTQAGQRRSLFIRRLVGRSADPLGATQMIEHEIYLRAWRSYKRNVRILWVLFLGFIPFGYGVIKPLMNIYQSDIPITIFALTWSMICFYSLLRISFFKCPRCGDLFFEKWIMGRFVGFYTGKCIHCGLQKYSLGSSNEFYGGA